MSLNKASKSPLARRLTISIILLSSAVTLVLTIIQLFWIYKTEYSSLEKQLEQIRIVHVRSVSESLWAANRKDLLIKLEGLVEIPIIAYAEVHDETGVWAAAGTRLTSEYLERVYHLNYFYHDEDLKIGDLVVQGDVSVIYDLLFQQAAIVLLSNGLKTFFVAIFMLVLFHTRINRHLIAMMEFFSNLSWENENARLVLDRKEHNVEDELSQLERSINRMVENSSRAHKELNRSHDMFHAIADYTVDWECWFSNEGKLVWVNQSVSRVTGYSPEECLVMDDFPIPLVVDSKDARNLEQELVTARKGSTVENIEFQIRKKDGDLLWVAMSWQPMIDVNGDIDGFRASVRDINRLKKIEGSLSEKINDLSVARDEQQALYELSQLEKGRIRSLLEAMNIGILFEDDSKKIIYFNPSFRRIWLVPDEINLEGKKTMDVLEHSANVLARPDHFSKHILNTLDTNKISDTFEIEMADGRIVTQKSYPVRDSEGRFTGQLWIYEDVTFERQTAEQLIYLAERDALTGLYNRHRFQEEMSRMMMDIDRRQSKGALLFFDLDEFKYINDTFGHRAGDTMLVRVASEVAALVRRNEVFSRIGGDEFAIFIPDSTKDMAINLAERIIRAVGAVPFNFEGQNLRLTTSLGMAICPDHGANAEELIAHADTAMYLAKDAGKNGWKIYDQEHDMSQEGITRMTWNDRITYALENDLFRLHFQGVYNAKTGELNHVEALIRMIDANDPDTLILPGHFIPAGEKTGRICDIDRWVIKNVIERLEADPNLPTIAVNISGRSFDDFEFPQYIDGLIREHNVRASRFMVELTETSAVSDLHDAQHFIESLHRTGCHVCLDDFGAGFSSFAYLKHLKADVLKIDGLFVRDLPNDLDNQIFVKSICDVASGLNKQTVAEFVEDESTMKILQHFGVDYLQGYYLSMPQADLEKLCNEKVKGKIILGVA